MTVTDQPAATGTDDLALATGWLENVAGQLRYIDGQGWQQCQPDGGSWEGVSLAVAQHSAVVYLATVELTGSLSPSAAFELLSMAKLRSVVALAEVLLAPGTCEMCGDPVSSPGLCRDCTPVATAIASPASPCADCTTPGKCLPRELDTSTLPPGRYRQCRGISTEPLIIEPPAQEHVDEPLTARAYLGDPPAGSDEHKALQSLGNYAGKVGRGHGLSPGVAATEGVPWPAENTWPRWVWDNAAKIIELMGGGRVA